MTCDLGPDDINVITVDYQGEPAARVPLAEGGAKAVAVKAFPKSVPLDFRALGGYEALKVFGGDDYVFVSRCSDGGATDDWGRPVLSARVLAFTAPAWAAWGRDPFLVGRFLAAEDVGEAMFGEMVHRLASMIEAGYPLADKRALRRLVSAAGLPLHNLGRAIAAGIVSHNVVVHGAAQGRPAAVATLMLAMLPVECLRSATFCSACADPAAIDRETIVIAGSAPAHKPSLTDSLLHYARGGQLRPDEPCVIDPAADQAPLVQSRAVPAVLCEAALDELLDGADWPGADFGAKHAAVVGYLGQRAAGSADALGAVVRRLGLAGAAAQAMERLDGVAQAGR